MITRVFRVQIPPGLREEFEEKFATTSIDAAESKKGFIRVSIHKPTKWAPNEYAMISGWENEESLIEFAGENMPSPVNRILPKYSCSTSIGAFPSINVLSFCHMLYYPVSDQVLRHERNIA